MSTFSERLAARVAAVGSSTCVGLDPHLERIPGIGADDGPEARARVVETFCLSAIEAVADVVAAVKPQSAFFEVLGAPGVAALQEVVAAARRAGLFVVLDAKRGDIGSTAEAYARATLDDDGPMGADAVTLSPYLGPESLEPFERRMERGKGVFVLVRTSNPGAAPWQRQHGLAGAVAAWVAARPQGAGAVIGATLSASEARHWRSTLPDSWLLVPGLGAQGAGPEQLAPLLGASGRTLATASRSVLFGAPGSDPGAIRERALAFRSAVASARALSAGPERPPS
ncbi:MAG TPA: orotidine-5'-phosphate decarboxylase [Deltaproteobacteria bacterium]|nr:orotidine-5'-phosphate decarboxylase [Deltaproteobacteria bacterium]